MTTNEYKKEMLKKISKMNQLMFEINELFEECETILQNNAEYPGGAEELNGLHDWFANEYPFSESFDETPWKVDAWGWALADGIEW